MQHFSVLSYNIWFGDCDRLTRLEALIATIVDLDPDIICLQEVIPDIYEVLKLKLLQYPHHFPFILNNRYGSVTISKHRMEECENKEFVGSRMGRSLLLTTIELPTEGNSFTSVIVGNTHFESEFQKKDLNNEKLAQYEYSYKTLNLKHKKNPNIIFCSDTNLLSHEEDKFFSDPEWKDSWKEKGCLDEQYTYDYFTNENLRLKNVGKFRSRLDRILYRKDNLEAIEFKVIKGINGMIPPSDHHGIVAIFAF